MIKLDDNLMAELGLATLPKEEKDAFLRHMYETLEMRVGTRLAEKMSEAQMTEFEQFINSNDEQGAFKWLETNFPNYKDVVAEEFEKLKSEVRPLAPQILASSTGAGAAPQPVTAEQQFQQAPHAQQMSQQAGMGMGPAPQQPAYQPAPPAPNPPVDYGPSSNPAQLPDHMMQAQTMYPGQSPAAPQPGAEPMMPQQPMSIAQPNNGSAYPSQPPYQPQPMPAASQPYAAPAPMPPAGPAPFDPGSMSGPAPMPPSAPAPGYDQGQGQPQYPQPITPPPYTPPQQ